MLITITESDTLDLKKYSGSFENLWRSCVYVVNKHIIKRWQYKDNVVSQLGYTPERYKFIFLLEVNDEFGITLADGIKYDNQDFLLKV